MSLTDDAASVTVTTPSDTEIVISRVFAAPRDRVFDALTIAELLVRWHGAQGWQLAVCEVDLRVGGRWRFVSRGPGGATMGTSGVYREVERPSRLVHTEVADGADAGEAVVTTELAEEGGRTTLTATVRYPTRRARDVVIESRMAGGVGESYDRLDRVLDETAIADRYRKVAAQFTARVRAVPEGAWDNPSPCDGWVARDVVRHLVEWLPAFFVGRWGIEAPDGPAVDADPAGAWAALDATIQAALDDPEVAGLERDTPMGSSTFARAIDMICTGDVLVHTWDLARATGLNDTLDADEVHRMLAGIEPMDEPMRQSGHYGPRVDVPADAPEQDRLIAFTGRRP
ncbi:MAG: TIGR03086 family protein [Acidimicrobiales bacterium]|nr:TIGR03086 family protein [Acidimicrobiales bacterium]